MLNIYNVFEDIEECNEGTSDCEQICNNNAGGYNCECYFGFNLHSDQKTCNKGTELQ